MTQTPYKTSAGIMVNVSDCAENERSLIAHPNNRLQVTSGIGPQRLYGDLLTLILALRHVSEPAAV